jgi:hypothetical protein
MMMYIVDNVVHELVNFGTGAHEKGPLELDAH